AVIGQDGRPKGVIAADVKAGGLAVELAHADFAHSASLELVDGQRRLLLDQANTTTQRVIQSDADLLAAGTLHTVINTDGARLALGGAGTVRYKDENGHDAYAGYAPVRSMG